MGVRYLLSLHSVQTSLSVPLFSHTLQFSVLQDVFGTHVSPVDDGSYPLLHWQTPLLSVLTSAGHEAMQPFWSGLTLFDEGLQVRQV